MHVSRNKMVAAISVFVIALIAFAVYEINLPTRVLFQTTKGDIIIQLRADKPLTTSRFVNLTKEGKYDGTTFYQITQNWTMFAGKISEVNTNIVPFEKGTDNRNLPYTVAMSKGAKDINGNLLATGTFYINLADNSDGGNNYRRPIPSLDSGYTVFGIVVQGQDIVDEIAKLPDNSVTVINASVIS